MVGTIGGGCVEAEVWNAAREVIETRKAAPPDVQPGAGRGLRQRPDLRRSIEYFCRASDAAADVLTFLAAGMFRKAFRKFANMAGFSTVIVDDREAFANAERFPEAEATYAEHYEDVFPKLPVTSSSYLIIVTRGHRDDMRVLRWAVTTRGPVHRDDREQAQDDLRGARARKRRLRRASCSSKVFAPMGLEIGAETPEEIAISVVAEMIATAAVAGRGLAVAFEIDFRAREIAGAV